MMTLFGTFFQSSVPLVAEKEEQAIKDWIYREEKDEEEVTVTTPISLKCYEKGYKLLTNMGYHDHRSLTGNKRALVEPLSITEGCNTQYTASLGFGLEDKIPTFDRRDLMSNESEDDDPPFVATTL